LVLGYIVYKLLIAVNVKLMGKKKKYYVTKIVKNIPTGRFIQQTVFIDLDF